jgi:hypothetical protein
LVSGFTAGNLFLALLMLNRYFIALLFILSCALHSGCDGEDGKVPEPPQVQLNFVRVGTYDLSLSDFNLNKQAPVDKPILGGFSDALDRVKVASAVELKEKVSGVVVPLTFSFLDSDKTFSALPETGLSANTAYVLSIKNQIIGATGGSFAGFELEFTTIPNALAITSILGEGEEIYTSPRATGIPINGADFAISFSAPLSAASISSSNFRISGQTNIPVTVSGSEDNRTVYISVEGELEDLTRYQLVVDNDIKGQNEETFNQYAKAFYTDRSAEPDFPLLSDEALLTLVQQQTFKYFYHDAQPASGMARERNSSGSLVTSGGSGFGLMALIVGIERDFISRSQGVARLDKILDFLETADRFHGAWSHWINGDNGDVIPFSANDNGGDLVETSFLVQGLITFRQYLNENDATEKALIDRINVLWQGVEWDWYTRGGQDVLYWHWSPDKDWIMNHQLRGYNETMITYVLAAASPDHSIPASAYHNGYARGGSIKNGKTFYNITLPLGEDYGGPLFFAHYSYLGLDPRNLSDTYANYWTQNVNHSLINQAYVKANPKNWVGYSEDNWGLTASDNHQGYSAHSPTNDLGVITPTAALSSFPYTPEESMKALKFFYYSIGDRLWGPYGFYDAFNLTEGWVADSYLAIDQGPIVVMIENYRTGLLWELFMSAPEVQDGLTKLGFEY